MNTETGLITRKTVEELVREWNLANAVQEAPGGVGETEFFKFRCFKNHNFHLEFKRPDLVQKLNEIGGNGLPMPGRDTP